MAPGIGPAVQGVLKALHPGLVSVIDHRGAGKGEQHQRRQPQLCRSPAPLPGEQAVVRPVCLALRRMVRTQKRQDAGSVMGAQKIHGGIERRRRIVLPQGLHGLPEIIGVAAAEIGQQSGAEGIVHQPVGLAAQQIPPPLGVGDLVGAIFPHLADENAVRGGLLHGGTDLHQKPVRQLIRHVQPPAGGSGPQPPADDGVLPINDKVHVGGGRLLHCRQGVDAPPGVIGVRPVEEAVPAVPGRVLTLGGAQGGIPAVCIEIDTLRAGVVEHTVQDHPHAPLLRLGAEGTEIVLGPQHGVDLRIVRRIVAVVGGGLKNGAQVQGGDAQGLQIVQLRRDPRQGAAEKVPVADLTVRVRPPLRRVVPVLMDPAAAHQPVRVRHRQAAEAVWKNLVSHAGAEPARRAAFPVDRQLPGICLPVAAITGLIQNTAGAVLPPEAEVIPDQLRLGRGTEDAGKTDPLAGRALQGQLQLLPGAGELTDSDQRTVREMLRGQGTAVKGDRCAADRGAEGLLAQVTAGVKDKGFAHGDRSP